MTTNDAIPLDAEELLHLALHEAEQNRTDKALLHLKQLLEQVPENGRAHYLLGALHAEIGLYDRAIQDMHAAVKFDPELETAHFQLGLLYLTSGHLEQAESAWQPLDSLGENAPLFLFKRGLLQLGYDDAQACIDDLKQGIALNSDNLKLNGDMQRIIDSAQELLQHASTQEQDQSDASGGRQTLLSAYQRTDYDKED